MRLATRQFLALTAVAFCFNSVGANSPFVATTHAAFAPSFGKRDVTSSIASLSFTQRGALVTLKEQNDSTKSGAFNLATIFGSGSSSTDKELTPHPSQREHRNPLNLLYPETRAVYEGKHKDRLPIHQDVKSGVLPNGFSYVILPNKSPPLRFEAHLQVFSGSGK